VDGNGRTARALFYWSILHYGFWACEYISISHIIRAARTDYSKAFVYTETDDNDLTYFIVYHIELLQRALASLDKYIQEKSASLKVVENDLRSRVFLNYRQRALISHALRHPGYMYSISSHMTSHCVSFNTAKSDLDGLAAHNLLEVYRATRPMYFRVPNDLEARLMKASSDV